MALDEEHRRPWPAPSSRWIWSQGWRDLLFLHWPVDAAVLRPLVPPTLELDRFDQEAWVTAVPFRMDRVRPRGLPSVPAISSFPEFNVRTYVTCDDKPGVFFLSIYAGGRMAAWLARRLSGLPYRFAPMRVVRAGSRTEFEVDAEAGFAASYEVRSEGAPAHPSRRVRAVAARTARAAVAGRRSPRASACVWRGDRACLAFLPGRLRRAL